MAPQKKGKNFGKERTGILTPTSIRDTSIVGGLNEFFINKCKNKEAGISNVLGAMIGSDKVSSFDELKSKTINKNSIFDPEFGNNVISGLNNLNITFIDSFRTIKEILSNLNKTLSTSTGKNIPQLILKLIVDTSNAGNLDSIIHSLEMVSDENLDKNMESLHNLSVLFETLNKITDPANGIISVAIQNTNTLGAYTENIKNTLNGLASIFEASYTISPENLKVLEAALTVLKESLTNIDTILGETAVIDISKKVEDIKAQLDLIKNLYANDIAVVATLITERSKDLEIIQEGVSKTEEVAVSAAKIREADIQRSIANISDIIDSVTMLSILMLIGGAIMKKHPDLIRGSLLFGATLAMFLMELMIPIALITRIASKNEIKSDIGKIIGFIAALSGIMIIGAFIVKATDIVISALKFGFILTAFLTMLMIPINMLPVLSKDENIANIEQINKIIITSSILLLIGSFIVNSIDIKAALKFGLVLGAFIGLLLVPFMIYGAIVNKATSVGESITKFVITCGFIMIIGALLGKNDNFIKNALKFGIVFGLFIAVSIAPVLLFALFKESVDKTIKSIMWFIISESLIMSIGAALVKNNKFIERALGFGILLMTFITLSILPILWFSKHAKALMVTLVQVIAFISICTFIMLVGTLFITNPKNIIYSLAFGLLLMTFMAITLTPFILFSKLKKIVMPALYDYLIFMLVCTGTLLIGSLIVKQFGWSALGAALLIAGFTASMMGIIKGLSKGVRKMEMTHATMIMLGIAALITSMGITLLIIRKLNPNFGDFAMLTVISAIAYFEVKMVLNLSKSLKAEQGKQALLTMLGVSAVILSAVLTMWLLRALNIDWDDYGRFVAVSAIVDLEVALVVRISKSLKAEQGKQALMIMGGITAVMLATVVTLWAIRKLGVSKEDFIWLVLINGLVLGEVDIVKRIVKDMKMKEPIQALIIMAGIAGVMLLSTLTLIIIKKANISILDVITLALLEFCLSKMGSLVKFIQGLKLSKKAIGTTAILAALMLGLSLSVSIIAKAGVEPKHIGYLALLEVCLVAMVGIAYLMGFCMTGPQAVVFTAGVTAAGILTAIFLALCGSMLIMVKAVKLAETIEDPKAITNVVNAFISAIMGIKFGDLAYLTVAGVLITTGVLAITPGLFLLARTVNMLANLTVVEEWDAKGNPTKYRHLKPEDFTDAATNIKTMISTLAEGIRAGDNVIGKIGLGRLLKTLFTVSQLGNIIGSIAEGVQAYVQLKVPEYNESTGKIKGYRLMKEQDFKDAAKGISAIILTVGGTIASIASGKGEIKMADGTGTFSAREFMRVVNDGNWLTGKSSFTKVLRASADIGQVISGIAKGLQAYAELMIPEYDENTGKIKRYKKMGKEDFTNAATNIKNVITGIADAVVELSTDDKYAGLFDEILIYSGFFGQKVERQPSKFMRILAGAVEISNVISGIAAGLKDMSELKFATGYDKDGKATGYITVGSTTMTKVTENITNILTAAINGVINALNSVQNPNTLKNAIEAIVPVGTVIGNIAKGVADMADLRIPTKFDNEGKAIEWAKMKEEDFVNSGSNIGRILTTVIDSINETYKSLKNDYSDAGIKDMFNAFTPVGELISNVAKSILDLASGKVTIDGKDQFITTEIIDKALSNVERLFIGSEESNKDSIFTILNSIYTANPSFFDTENGEAEIIKTGINNVLTILGDYADNVAKFANLENIDKVTKNISKLINKDTGLLGIITKEFATLTAEDKANLKSYAEIIDTYVPIYTAISSIAAAIDADKESLNSIIKYNETTSIFDTINTFVGTVLTSASVILTNLKDNNIKKVVNKSDELFSYLKVYNELFNTIQNVIEPLYQNINTLYDTYFVNNTLSDKLNTIMTAINNIFIEPSNTETTKKSLRKERKLIKAETKNVRKMTTLLNDEINAYIDVLNNLVKIAEIKINNEKLSKISSNATSISKLFYDTEKETDGIIITTLSFISTMGSKYSLKNINKGSDQLDAFSQIVIKLNEMSGHFTVGDMEVFTKINTAVTELSKGIDSIGNVKQKKLDVFAQEVESLDRFVKAVDNVDVSKVAQLNSLMQSMNNLANNMEGVDKLVKLLESDFKDVITSLSEKIEQAKKTIANADRIEAERQKKLESNISQISRLINNPINIKVGGLNNDNNINAAYENLKEKK